MNSGATGARNALGNKYPFIYHCTLDPSPRSRLTRTVLPEHGSRVCARDDETFCGARDDQTRAPRITAADKRAQPITSFPRRREATRFQ